MELFTVELLGFHPIKDDFRADRLAYKAFCVSWRYS
jgi:hypothetical protein